MIFNRMPRGCGLYWDAVFFQDQFTLFNGSSKFETVNVIVRLCVCVCVRACVCVHAKVLFDRFS